MNEKIETEYLQARARLSEEMWRLLCDISFCGDNDEGISKHIIHALTAICLGMTWEECLDYKTGGWTIEQINQLEAAEAKGITHTGDTRPQWLELCEGYDNENKARLAPLWNQVQNIANELGIEEFYNMLREERFERWTWGRIPMYAQDHHRYDKVEVPEWLKDIDE